METKGVSAVEPIGDETVRKKRGGPEKKMRRLFERASKLPRSGAEKIAAFKAFVK